MEVDSMALALVPKALSKAALKSLMRKAHEAGMAAGKAAMPPTMVVSRRADPLNDASPVVKEWIVPDGPCGFASVTIRPANSRAAKVMAEVFDGKFGGRASRNSYSGGMMLWVYEFNQSLVRKEAYARAFAEVLRDAGIERVSSDSRMD
jgi:hypothetical protein